MKKICIFLITLFAVNWAMAQRCLPEGIAFTSQAQIDSFQIKYPGCTEIEGNITITDHSGDISNLNGLNVLTSVWGYLNIVSNNSLTSLIGLNNLSYIGGFLNIGGNGALTSLIGLNNVSIEGSLSVVFNDSLTSLTGLNNLSSIVGGLYISGNDTLMNLTGLDSLKSIGGSLNIIETSLTSLSGIDNIKVGSISDITIRDNYSLSFCNVKCICDYLASPNGKVDIYANSAGCNKPLDIAGVCGFSLPCLPYGNYYFLSQADIDNFQIGYPSCASLKGNVIIMGSDISDLKGLNPVTSIRGALNIGYLDKDHHPIVGNPKLTTLSGLENLTYIGGDLFINYNDTLSSLTGLDNLTSIGGSLLIGVAYVYPTRDNSTLKSLEGLRNLLTIGGTLEISSSAITNFSGLDNLIAINGDLSINFNDSLISLAGLDNLNAASINYLSIDYNQSLSDCAVKSICAYLASPNGSIDVHDNAEGCLSIGEIAAGCDSVSVRELTEGNPVSIYPNPASGIITIETNHKANLTILNLNGQQLITRQIIEPKTQIDISSLPSGIFFVKILGDKRIQIGKIIKE